MLVVLARAASFVLIGLICVCGLVVVGGWIVGGLALWFDGFANLVCLFVDLGVVYYDCFDTSELLINSVGNFLFTVGGFGVLFGFAWLVCLRVWFTL